MRVVLISHTMEVQLYRMQLINWHGTVQMRAQTARLLIDAIREAASYWRQVHTEANNYLSNTDRSTKSRYVGYPLAEALVLTLEDITRLMCEQLSRWA